MLTIDWDLEAPGLHHYFLTPGKLEAKRLQVTPARQAGGLWSLLSEARERGDGKAEREHWALAVASVQVPPMETSRARPFVPTPQPIDVLPAGHVSADYGPQLSAFSWEAFFRDSKGGEWLESIREQWVVSYDFVLIDSRTGVTDSGGVCTIQLPDTLVLVFSANDQSFDGGLKVIAAAQKARTHYGHDRGQLTVIPLLSRWAGDQETDIAEEWMQRFDRELPPMMASWLPNGFSPRQFLERVRVPYVARFTFGEPLPVLTHSLTDPLLPGLAFENLARLLDSNFADAGTLIDPSYTPRVAVSRRQDIDRLEPNMLATDPIAIHQMLARIARVRGRDSEEYVAAVDDAASRLRQSGNYAEAEALYRRALALDSARLGENEPLVATRLNNLALLLKDTNRQAEAEPLFRRALAIDELRLGPDHPNVAIRLNNLAELLRAANRLAEAEPLYRRVLAINEASLGPDHPNVARDLNNLATLLYATNRLAEAEPLFRRALAIDEASLGPDHPNVATSLNNLGGLQRSTNRLAEAEPLYRRALAITEASLGPDHPNVATSLNNLAGLLDATNRLSEAEPLYRRALAIDEAGLGPDHPNVAHDLNNLVELLHAMNRLAEAEPLSRRMLLILLKFQRATGDMHPNRDVALGNFVTILQDLGRTQEAIIADVRALVAEAGLEGL